MGPGQEEQSSSSSDLQVSQKQPEAQVTAQVSSSRLVPGPAGQQSQGWAAKCEGQGAWRAQAEAPDEASLGSFSQLSSFHRSVVNGYIASLD